jgi:hypothetical protein
MIRSAKIEKNGRYEVCILIGQDEGSVLLARTHDYDHALYIHYCNQDSLLTDTRI